MIKTGKAKFIFFSVSSIIIVLMAVLAAILIRGWERDVRIENSTFTESSRELHNPNRGFYRLYIFQITDEKQDYPQVVPMLYQHDTDTELTLIEICLKSYREGAITKEGLANIEALFAALGTLDKQLIVRFIYDSEGKNDEYEPESLDIILTHMEQLSYILRKYSGKIFTLQGLFIGNWGEMNGTRYSSDEDLRRLARKLANVTEQTTYLAVRSPAQWRSIMQLRSLRAEGAPDNLLSGRLGLFNDGMLGNESDYGTYQTGEYTDAARYPRWGRKEELKFQDELCGGVPNGGEVINDNLYNNLDRAIKDFELMHITYLNQMYDEAVLEKWSKTVVTEEGCFNGMDGLTYIERHLGYRLVIVDAGLCYQREADMLTAEVTLKNVGFAPLYKGAKVRMILYDEKKGSALIYPIDQDVHTLAGGSQKEDTLTLSVDIPFGELTEKEYTVYFSIVDLDTGKLILLGNEETEEQYGYQIGTVSQQYKIAF